MSKTKRCAAKTEAGKRCKNPVSGRSKYCASHRFTRSFKKESASGRKYLKKTGADKRGPPKPGTRSKCWVGRHDRKIPGRRKKVNVKGHFRKIPKRRR
jgi:hypothetical protein